jgi:hypothetical protein
MANAKSFHAESGDARLETLALESEGWRLAAFINKTEKPLDVSCELLNARWPEAKSQFERPLECYAIEPEDREFTLTKLKAPEGKLSLELPPLSMKMIFVEKTPLP